MENNMEVLQKTKHRVTTLFSDPAFGHINPPKWEQTCTFVFTAAFHTMAKRCK